MADPKKPWVGPGVQAQAKSQVAAADGLPIEWHVNDEAGAEALRDFFHANGINIKVVHDPYK